MKLGITGSYIAIDLKSFYASVECADRNLDPLTTNLVVADPSRTDKTIWLDDLKPYPSLTGPDRGIEGGKDSIDPFFR